MVVDGDVRAVVAARCLLEPLERGAHRAGIRFPAVAAWRPHGIESRRALRRKAASSLLPAVCACFEAVRKCLSGDPSIPGAPIYGASGIVGYSVDLFGRPESAGGS